MDWYGDKRGHGIEYHILVLALAMLVIFKGAGAFSLDQVLSRHLGALNSVKAGIDAYGGVIMQ
jgi:putative oxidoreductase